MIRVLLFLLVLIGKSFSQNSELPLSKAIYDGLYNHFNNIGIKCTDSLQNLDESEFDCYLYTIRSVVFNIEKKDYWILKGDSTSESIDKYILDKIYNYDLHTHCVLSDIKFLKKKVKNPKSICISVNIRRTSIIYNPLIFKRQIRYRMKIKYKYF